jgi:integrase
VVAPARRRWSGRCAPDIAEGIDVARRANGEGSIFRRKDGTWSAELSYRDE